MNTMIRQATLGLALLLLGLPTTLHAQTAIDHTTFSMAVAATDTTITLSAASGSGAGDYIYAEGELMQIQSAVNDSTTQWNVRRGLAEGATPARAHSTSAIVWVLDAEEGRQFNVAGTCTASNERFLPHINTRENRIYDCASGGVWIERDADRVSIPTASIFGQGRLRLREEFNTGFSVMQDDGTDKSLTDAEVNLVWGSVLGMIGYREELSKTTSSWVTINGELDVSADDTTNDEGVEILFAADAADPTLSQVLEAGTHGACVAAMVTIADISGTDKVVIGWRQNEAFVDGADHTGYTIWNTVGVTATDGSINSQQEVSEATDTDDSGVNWADGERRALKVCISAAGVPTAYYSNASPDNEEPIYTAITMTETGSTLTAGTGLVPYFTYLAAGTDGADVTVQWVELTWDD